MTLKCSTAFFFVKHIDPKEPNSSKNKQKGPLKAALFNNQKQCRLCCVCFSSLFGFDAGAVSLALCIDVAFHEFNNRQRRVVASAEASLHDADVAAVAGCIASSQRIEQLCNELNVANS